MGVNMPPDYTHGPLEDAAVAAGFQRMERLETPSLSASIAAFGLPLAETRNAVYANTS